MLIWNEQPSDYTADIFHVYERRCIGGIKLLPFDSCRAIESLGDQDVLFGQPIFRDYRDDGLKVPDAFPWQESIGEESATKVLTIGS